MKKMSLQHGPNVLLQKNKETRAFSAVFLGENL